MRFLIDNALPPRLAKLLSQASHDAVHVRAYSMGAARDHVILEKAVEEDRIIVSADTDFGTILAALESDKPSFILFRNPTLLQAEDYASALLRSLSQLETDLITGCVVVFRSDRIRVRKLPIVPL